MEACPLRRGLLTVAADCPLGLKSRGEKTDVILLPERSRSRGQFPFAQGAQWCCVLEGALAPVGLLECDQLADGDQGRNRTFELNPLGMLVIEIESSRAKGR